VRTVYVGRGTPHADVVDLNGAVPATGTDHVLVDMVPLDAKDSVGMTWQFALLFHFEGKRLGGLIVDTNVLVATRSGQKSSVRLEANRVEVILGIFANLMETLSRSGVPVLQNTISLCRDEDIRSLHGSRLWTPCQVGDGHLFVAAHAHQSEG
jgi:hypothetical protein